VGRAAKGLGRPPKFPGPSRVVTMTLPESTLADLEAIDPDRARAVVRATEIATTELGNDEGKVDILAVNKDVAVITMPHSQLLTEIRGLNLIEIIPSRYLVLLEPGLPLAELELSILDAIEELPEAEARDRAILCQFLEFLRSFRRSDRAKTGELILVAL
jgi:hypothetical protein